MWLFMALLSAVLAASRRTNEKRLTTRLNHFTIGFVTQLFGLPIVGAVLLLHHRYFNPFHLGWRFWIPTVFVSALFYPLNALLYLQSIKHNELSSVLPIQSLWPVLTLIPAWLTLGEVPTPLAVCGIALTVCGVYALGLKKKRLHSPLQPFREDKASRYMLLGVCLVTVAGIMDKIAIGVSDAIYYSFSSTLVAVCALYATMRWQKVDDFAVIRNTIRELGLIGTLQGASYTTYLMAIGAGPVAYVSAIRSSNVLMGSVLGVVLLKEKLTRAKVLSFCLILVGGVLLALGS